MKEQACSLCAPEDSIDFLRVEGSAWLLRKMAPKELMWRTRKSVCMGIDAQQGYVPSVAFQ